MRESNPNPSRILQCVVCTLLDHGRRLENELEKEAVLLCPCVSFIPGKKMGHNAGR